MFIPKLTQSQYLSDYAQKEVFVLDFSQSPTGNHKYLRSKRIVEQALAEGKTRICIITAGNAGKAILQEIIKVNATGDRKLFLTCIVSHRMSEKRRRKLESPYSTIISCDLDTIFLSDEDQIELAKTHPGEGVFNATALIDLEMSAITEQFKHKIIDTVLVPVGSGELFVSFWNQFKTFPQKPKLIGVLPAESHPLCKIALEDPLEFEKTYKFNALTSSISFKYLPAEIKDHLLSLKNEGCAYVDISNEEITNAYMLSQKAGYVLEPSSSLPLALLRSTRLESAQRVACILTGKNIDEIEEL